MENDLADTLDDLICTFDKGVSDVTSDILLAFVGWLVFAAGIFLLTTYIIKSTPPSSATEQESPTALPLNDPTRGFEGQEQNKLNSPIDDVTDSHTNKDTTANIVDKQTPSPLDIYPNDNNGAMIVENTGLKSNLGFSPVDPPTFTKTTQRCNDYPKESVYQPTYPKDNLAVDSAKDKSPSAIKEDSAIYSVRQSVNNKYVYFNRNAC